MHPSGCWLLASFIRPPSVPRAIHLSRTLTVCKCVKRKKRKSTSAWTELSWVCVTLGADVGSHDLHRLWQGHSLRHKMTKRHDRSSRSQRLGPPCSLDVTVSSVTEHNPQPPAFTLHCWADLHHHFHPVVIALVYTRRIPRCHGNL